MSDILNVKDLPDQLRVVLSLLGYRRRKVILTLCTGVEIYGMQWDGGSRNEWFTVSASGSIAQIVDTERTWPDNMGSLGVRDLTQESPMVLCGGTFCGKVATMKLYIHPRYAQAIGIQPIGYSFDA